MDDEAVRIVQAIRVELEKDLEQALKFAKNAIEPTNKESDERGAKSSTISYG